MSDNPLKAFRASAAELDDERAERMRQRVVGIVAAEEIGTNPPDTANQDRVSTGHARLDTPLRDYPLAPSSTRRRSQAPAFAVLIVVLALIATAALMLARHTSAPSADEPKRLPDLRSIAGTADALPDQPLATGSYQYRRITSGSQASGRPVTEEVWVAADGTGLVRTAETSGTLSRSGTTVSPVHEDTDIASTRHFGGWFYEDLRQLPTDAQKLRATLGSTAGGNLSSAEIGRLATDLVSWTATPPAVRSAAFQVLSDVGFAYVDDAAVQGRTGQRWVLNDEAGAHFVVLDPASTRPVAFYDVPPGVGPEIANATRWIVYEAAEYRPTGGMTAGHLGS